MKKPTILIVEDESIIALDLKTTLEEKGYKILPMTSHASEAVKTVQKHKPDVILMDIFLKGDKTGIDAAAEITQKYQVPVIYLTGNINLLDSQTLQRIHSFEVITKPPLEHELLSAIEKVLNT